HLLATPGAGGNKADAQLRPAEKQAEQLQTGLPFREVPAVRGGEDGHTRLHADSFDVVARFDLIEINPTQRNLNAWEIYHMAVERWIEVAPARKNLSDRGFLQLVLRPPIRVGFRLHGSNVTKVQEMPHL